MLSSIAFHRGRAKVGDCWLECLFHFYSPPPAGRKGMKPHLDADGTRAR